MIRAAFIALSLLTAAPALAGPTDDGHRHEAPDYVFSEAPMDHTVGSADAANTLIVYASNVCPHCGSWFANEWPTIKSELVETDKLRVVFRPLSSAPIQLSLTGFLMAECAGDEKYMDIIENQFARQPAILDAVAKNDGAAIKMQYDSLANDAGLTDEASISACLAEEAHLKTLQTSAARAGAAGISTIPSFIFDGQLMKGASGAAAIKGWVEGRSSIR